MWQRAQSPLSYTHTHTHLHTRTHTLMKGYEALGGQKKNFKHLSCAFSVMNNVLIEIA